MDKKYVLGFGGANADLHIRCKSRVLLHDSNPSVMSSSPGGVMRNILDNMSRLGTSCRLLSAVGNDPNGRMLLESCKERGIDVSAVWISDVLPTSCYMDVLDPDGDMFVAANDMAVIEEMPEECLYGNRDMIAGASALVIDTNPPEERLIRFCEYANCPIFADPVSAAKGGKLKAVLPGLFLIKPNLLELELLSGIRCSSHDDIKKAAEKILTAGCHSVAVSLGSEGCYYADRNGESFFMRLDPIENMANATGAGDAFMAGLVSAYADGLDPSGMVARGLACGRLAVQCRATINPQLSMENVKKELEHGLQKLS